MFTRKEREALAAREKELVDLADSFQKWHETLVGWHAKLMHVDNGLTTRQAIAETADKYREEATRRYFSYRRPSGGRHDTRGPGR